MWVFKHTKALVEHVDGYQVDVVLENDGMLKTFREPEEPQRFQLQPNPHDLEIYGQQLAIAKNIKEQARAKNHVTLYEFRQRFTFNERVAIDNYFDSQLLDSIQKGQVRTVLKDWESCKELDVSSDAVSQSIYLLVSTGLLSHDRAAEILNTVAV